MESDFSIVDSPFQMICVPMQTSRNEESRMMTAMEVAPRIPPTGLQTHSKENAARDQHCSDHRAKHGIRMECSWWDRWRRE